MNVEHNKNDGIAVSAVKAFWRTRQFWSMVIPIVLICMSIGYIIGTWYTSSVYKEQSESRKAILAQCIANNDKLTSQLAALGNKTATALDKITSERQ